MSIKNNRAISMASQADFNNSQAELVDNQPDFNDNPAIPIKNQLSPILVIEDEERIASLIIDYLKSDNFATIWVKDGGAVVKAVKQHMPSLILLDIMLPTTDGFQLCRQIRQFSQVPIIMVTARAEERDRLLGFDLGVDDYICKPFSPRELVSRVKAVFKRLGNMRLPLEPAVDRLDIDSEAYKARFDGITLDLTPVEFRLLKAFSQSRGRVFSRDELLEHIYPGHQIVNDRNVDSHVKNLRKKLKAIEPDDEIFHSVYGVGYKMELSL